MNLLHLFAVCLICLIQSFGLFIQAVSTLTSLSLTTGSDGSALNAADITGIWRNTNGYLYVSDASKVYVSTSAVSNGASINLQTAVSSLSSVHGMVGDVSAGDLYVMEDLSISKIAGGNGVKTNYWGNNSFSNAALQVTSNGIYAYGLGVDANSNIFIYDGTKYRIFKIDSTSGSVSLKVGISSYGKAGDGDNALKAKLGNIYMIFIDTTTNIYIADYTNNLIRKIDGTTNIISTIAGGGTNTTSYGMKATSAGLAFLMGMTMNTLGEIFFSEYSTGRYCVRKIDGNGIISMYAGTFGSSGSTGDNGPATSAYFLKPYGLFLNSAGDLYIADSSSSTGGNRVRKVLKSNGYIYAFAGNGTSGYSGNGGQAISATLKSPYGCYGDSNGVIYIADYGNNVIRKVAVDGIITTIAGKGISGTTISGSIATNTPIQSPTTIVMNTAGEIYFTASGILSKVSNGIITTYPTSTTPNVYSTSNINRLLNPETSFLDTNGNMYVTSQQNKIYKYNFDTSPSTIQLLAGTGDDSSTGDGGQATSASFNGPYGISVVTNGDIYISEQNDQIIRKIDSSGIVSTFAGTLESSGSSGDGGLATSARLSSPRGIFIDQTNSQLFFADFGNNKIRVVNMLTKIISTISGGSTGGSTSGSTNGAATSATFYGPINIFVTTNRDIYVADYGNNKIRLITYSTMIVSTIAGTGTQGHTGDGGSPTSALLYYPRSVYVTTSGVIYIGDTNNYAIRKIENNTITKFAGTYLTPTYTGDGGQATSATFELSYSVIVDTSGNVYITDNAISVIRKITTDNIINTISVKYSKNNISASDTQFLQISAMWMDTSTNLYATDQFMNNVMQYSASENIIYTLAGGSGICGSSGDGSYSINALLCYPSGIIGDSNGNIYVSDSANHKVRYISASTYKISTIVGTGTLGYGGDNGAATSALLNLPTTLALDSDGNLLISDYGNKRIRYYDISALTIVSIVDSSMTLTPSNYFKMDWVQSGANDNYIASEDHIYHMVESFGPTLAPVFQPTSIPSSEPSSRPSLKPTRLPSSRPSSRPSSKPSVIPSASPSSHPTSRPSNYPSSKPSSQPSVFHIFRPSSQPSSQPTQPTSHPSFKPTCDPSSVPSARPSEIPSSKPSNVPTSKPSFAPTSIPSIEPSSKPSTKPSCTPTSKPTIVPSGEPSSVPSGLPTVVPTSRPSSKPSDIPSSKPSNEPTSHPSSRPSSKPSNFPSSQPTSFPSLSSTHKPSSCPSSLPSSQPYSHPTSLPSSQPTLSPTSLPSSIPSSVPTSEPSSDPTSIPSSIPSSQPSSVPSTLPTSLPTSLPSSQPTSVPSLQPTGQPTTNPTRTSFKLKQLYLHSSKRPSRSRNGVHSRKI